MLSSSRSLCSHRAPEERFFIYKEVDMPYAVEKRGDKWVTINTETGKVKGTHDTKKKAIRQMRLLYGIESGKWKPTGAKAKT